MDPLGLGLGVLAAAVGMAMKAEDHSLSGPECHPTPKWKSKPPRSEWEEVRSALKARAYAAV